MQLWSEFITSNLILDETCYKSLSFALNKHGCIVVFLGGLLLTGIRK